MPRPRLIILYTVVGFAGLLALSATALLFLVDANVYKPRLETTVSRALGMEVSIRGQLGFAVFPRLRVKLEDVQLRNRGADAASAKEAALQIDLLPLLRN